jgi:glucokinase
MSDLALGIDIGGTHTKIGLVDRTGTISHLRRFATDARGADAAPFLNHLLTHTGEVLAQAGTSVMGIGLSVHGHIDRERRGPILCENTPALRGVNLRGLLEEQFACTVVVNNDLSAHALAEYHFGSGAGARRFLCLAVGTGIGAGVIADGEALRYIEGTAGDTGRLILDPNGPPDVYGVRGTVESFCGVAGIERTARERYGHDVPASEVIRAAREGSGAAAVEIMSEVGSSLGHVLALLTPVFLPDRIALTGGTTEAGGVLLEACRRRFDLLMGDYQRTLARYAPEYYSEIEIVLGRMRGETGVVGAVIELFNPKSTASPTRENP